MSEEGVYICGSGGRVELKGDLPDGLLVVYFDNIKCPFCRRFDEVWERLVKDDELSQLVFIRVVCKYFHKDCRDEFASRLYREYDITRSPTVFLFNKKEDSISYRELLPAMYGYDFDAIKNELMAFLLLGI